MAKLFCIRAEGGEYAEAFLKGGYAAIGWLNEKDLSKIKSKPELEVLYREAYPKDNNRQVGLNVGQIYRFLKGIEVGDSIVVPALNNKIYLGQVIEENNYYLFGEKDSCPYNQRKRVKWFDAPQDRSILLEESSKMTITMMEEFASIPNSKIPDLSAKINSLRSLLTVFEIKHHNQILLEIENNQSGEIFKMMLNIPKSGDGSQETKSRVSPIESEQPTKLDENEETPSLSGGNQYTSVMSFGKMPESTSKIVTLFYGTTRNKLGGNDWNKYYGGDFDENETVILKQGICNVSIPKTHIKGNIERPLNLIIWKFPEEIQIHVVITQVLEQSKLDFNSLLLSQVNSSKDKSALIFIHGFNTSFAQAAQLAAQITYDIPFNENISGFFSWPSKGGIFKYNRDKARVEACVMAFADFIENLVDDCNVKSLNFIAHSMGSEMLTLGLLELTRRESFQNKISSISQIILAAPDIDQTTFKASFLPYLRNIGKSRTLYTSKADLALKFSQFKRGLKRGLKRLGQGGKSVFVEKGIDTIDASFVESGIIEHSYVFECKETLTDLFYLIIHKMEAGERGLEKLEKNNLTYYRFAK